VSSQAPPGPRRGLADAARTTGRAAVGGTLAFATLIVVGQLVGVVGFLLVGGYGLWSWAKVGLLTALLSLRADVVGTARGAPIFAGADVSIGLHLRFVPMVLTIGFLVLAAAAGRRAARARSGRVPLLAAGLVAVGAAVPAALLAMTCATLVRLSFPVFDLRLRVDIAGAGLWTAALTAAGAGIGAYLEAARGRAAASALRGGLTAYGWALGLLAIGVFVVATLEPAVTRGYVDALSSLGTGGGILFSAHLLAIPAQSALLFAPAAGSCLELVGEGSLFELCPWHLAASGPAGGMLFPDALPLSPWLWLLSPIPAVAATLGGRRSVAGTTNAAWRAAGLGAAAGVAFASLVVVGGWVVAPQLSSDFIPARHISMHPAWAGTALAALLWGVAGGVLGALLARRGYEEPGLPRPTSA
jgi:hypothetical protein